MIHISNKENCCGCGACRDICPQKCISMQPDYEGFLYPKVNAEKCTNCHLCEEICPERNETTKKQTIQAVAIRNKDKNVLLHSTSGGFFSALCKYFSEEKGHIYGVLLDVNNKVCHVEFPQECDDIDAFRGSKYVQSDLRNCFSSIKRELRAGDNVLFSGTACQIAGLKNYLKKEYHNLVTVEVICHGTPSPLLWQKYIEYLESKENAKVVSSNFRNKKNGYHSGVMAHVFSNGKRYYRSGRTDFFLKAFFSEISSRPSCYTCSYKGKMRVADFSIFDCWHAAELNSEIVEDDKGYTNVFINSDRGVQVFNAIREGLDVWPVSIEEATLLDGVMITQYPKRHEKRAEFYESVNNIGLQKTVSKYIPISYKDYFVEQVKGIIAKLGLMYRLKKVLKRKR